MGPYTIERELARGGMGAIYVARQRGAGRRVALKLLLSHPGGAKLAQLQRFQTEARAAARLRHPNVVAIHDVGQIGGYTFLSMDLIEGEALDGVLRRGPLEPRRAAEIAAQVAEGVQAAHEAGVLHRDLKPANVLLTAEGRALVTDFGLAKDLHQGQNLTQTGQLLGTPAFMPPEQAGGEGKRADERADVYGLGATLFALLTGRAPFQGANLVAILAQVSRGEAPAPSSLTRRVPPELDAICLACLCKDPAERYPSAGELAAELRRFLAGEPIERLAAASPGRSSRRALLAGAGAAAIGATAGWWLLSRPAEAPARSPTPGRSGPAPPAGVARWTWRRRPGQRERWLGDAAFDGERVLHFGGVVEDQPVAWTEVWEEGAWRRLDLAGPPARDSHALVPAPGGGVYLLGGRRGREALGDLWRWKSGSWQPLPSQLPAPLWGQGAASDLAGGRVFLVGGSLASGLSPDWCWSPAADRWEQLPPGPPRRRFCAAAFDPRRRRLVVFGGDLPGGKTTLGDLWEWDGEAWTQREGPGPLPRRGARFVDDGERLLLFGGGVAREHAYDDVWTWDGVEWRELAPPERPPARLFHSAAYDAARAEVVVAGGAGAGWRILDDRWVAGEFLSEAEPPPEFATRPPPARTWSIAFGGSQTPALRDGHERAMAYDPEAKELLLFGGWNGKIPFADLWAWRGKEWHSYPSSTPWPAARYAHVAAYDAARRRLVLFGGHGLEGYLDDTLWEFDGTRWEALRPPAPGPGPRCWACACYDPRLERVLLFGGAGAEGADRSDLWAWDGERWELCAEEGLGPRPRRAAALCHDARRGRSVLFGGLGYRDVLWEWDGQRWHRPAPAPGPRPPSTQAPGLAWDGERVLLWGGFRAHAEPTLSQDLWAWDGQRWYRSAPAESGSGRRPPARVFHAAGWDHARGKLFVFGGQLSRARRTADAWQLG